MKIVKILGGLGNQMFQYALYLALKARFPDEAILIDVSCFRGYPLHNGFELDRIFSVNYQVAKVCDIAKVAYPYFHYRCWQIGKYILPIRKTMCIEQNNFALDLTILTKTGNCYYDGYWQHEDYFETIKSQIYKAFTFPIVKDSRNVDIISKVKSANSVSLHIRRGDYVKHPFFSGICDLAYYKKAIEYMMVNVKPELYCLFSDDIGWCQENLKDLLPAENTICVDWNWGDQNYIDMQIMSCCKHNIIANSSFSWWGAYLNRNPYKVVIAPKRWYNQDVEDPVSDSWVRM